MRCVLNILPSVMHLYTSHTQYAHRHSVTMTTNRRIPRPLPPPVLAPQKKEEHPGEHQHIMHWLTRSSKTEVAKKQFAVATAAYSLASKKRR
jgi:hypothetical protein